MNRKLRHTILAFSVTGTMLALGLLAARPALPEAVVPAVGAIALATTPGPAPQSPTRTTAGQRQASAAAIAAGDAMSARIEARSRRFEADMAKVESAEAAIAATAGFVAAVTTEAVLLEMHSADTVEEETRPAAEAAPETRKRGGGVRGAIAVPYFSFARGMGRGARS